MPGRRAQVRLELTASLAALVTGVTMVAAVQAVRPAPASADGASAASGAVTGQAPVWISAPNRAASPLRPPYALRTPGASGPPAASGPPVAPARQAAARLTLTAADHRDCPATVTACVDLARHLTWLQSRGRVTFGPVQMEPGQPGSAHQTPRGTFRVLWKAGPSFVSDTYHEAMPWAVFFAAGGIAFHAGSLTRWSHGCVHLTLANAHYYNVHLPIDSVVRVF